MIIWKTQEWAEEQATKFSNIKEMDRKSASGPEFLI